MHTMVLAHATGNMSLKRHPAHKDGNCGNLCCVTRHAETMSLAADLKDEGITVIAYCPGWYALAVSRLWDVKFCDSQETHRALLQMPNLRHLSQHPFCDSSSASVTNLWLLCIRWWLRILRKLCTFMKAHSFMILQSYHSNVLLSVAQVARPPLACIQSLCMPNYASCKHGQQLCTILWCYCVSCVWLPSSCDSTLTIHRGGWQNVYVLFCWPQLRATALPPGNRRNGSIMWMAEHSTRHLCGAKPDLYSQKSLFVVGWQQIVATACAKF